MGPHGRQRLRTVGNGTRQVRKGGGCGEKKRVATRQRTNISWRVPLETKFCLTSPPGGKKPASTRHAGSGEKRREEKNLREEESVTRDGETDANLGQRSKFPQ